MSDGRGQADSRAPALAQGRRRYLRFLLPALLALTASATLVGAALLWSLFAANRRIDALAAGRDVEVGSDARPAEVAARAAFLLQRERFDEALPLTERAAAGTDPEIAAAALYNGGNAHMRRAFARVGDSHFDAATADVNLAKDYYRRALRVAPGFWDAKYNLDIAMRLVRDFPEGPADDQDPPRQSKRAWAELPGLPKGGP